MIKIVNGKIVREGVVSTATSGSPIPQRRRGSIQDLQIKEYEQEQLQKLATPTEEEPSGPITWTEILSLKINVFGIQLSAKNLLIMSTVALLAAGLTGLLTSLLVLYIGTLFTTGVAPAQTSQQQAEDVLKASPNLSSNSNPLRTSGESPSLRSSTSGLNSPSLRASGGGNSSPLIRPIGSPSLRPLHPRLVTLKSLELDSLNTTPSSGTTTCA